MAPNGWYKVRYLCYDLWHPWCTVTKYSTTVTMVLWLVLALAPNAESQHKASVGTQVAYQTVDGDKNDDDLHHHDHYHDDDCDHEHQHHNIFSNGKANTNTTIKTAKMCMLIFCCIFTYSMLALQIQIQIRQISVGCFYLFSIGKAGSFRESCSLIAARFSTL